MNLPQQIFSKIIRAVVEFEMIDDGDKILIGLSGGKDSLMLLYSLKVLQERVKKNFSLAAVTIDPKFKENFAEEILPAKKLCDELGISHRVEEVDIASVIAAQKNKSPCFSCAYFRRAAINRIADEIGAKKVAYAHHLDDAVETFLMSEISSGQLTTFLPKTFLDRSGVTVIRPLVYLREKEISRFAEKNFNVVKSPCPFDGATNRQKIKNLIADLEEDFPNLFANLAAAMRKNSVGDLWDAQKSRKEMFVAYKNLSRSQ